MEQVEILRRFIQRVQAMKSPDHNGEDNFARDFMVSVRSRRRLVSPAAELPSPLLAGLGCQRFVCGARTGAGRAPSRERLRRACGRRGHPRPSASFFFPRPVRRPPCRPGSEGSGRRAQPAPAPLPATTYCLPGRAAATGVRARLPTPAFPACPSGEGQGELSGCGRPSCLRLTRRARVLSINSLGPCTDAGLGPSGLQDCAASEFRVIISPLAKGLTIRNLTVYLIPIYLVGFLFFLRPRFEVTKRPV